MTLSVTSADVPRRVGALTAVKPVTTVAVAYPVRVGRTAIGNSEDEERDPAQHDQPHGKGDGREARSNRDAGPLVEEVDHAHDNRDQRDREREANAPVHENIGGITLSHAIHDSASDL